MRILAIETSCDETAIAIADFSGSRNRPRIRVAANIVSSQVALHAKFGGVVPNLAKWEHQKNLVPILLQALRKIDGHGLHITKPVLRADKNRNTKYEILNTILEREPELLRQFKKRIAPLKKPKIDAIAVTYGPGLAPALWVGVNFAKALAELWGVPVIPINHMAGHLYSALLQKSGIGSTKHEARNPKQLQKNKSEIQNIFEFRISNFEFPAIALLVSGGHTELVLVRGWGKYKIIGETLDDAAGEAFDKTARLLGLGYPGGPEIAAAAAKSQITQNKLLRNLTGQANHKSQIKLPRPMLKSGDYNFSFSGLKTAVLYLLRDHPELTRSKTSVATVAKEFQNAVVDVLVTKTIRAAQAHRAKTVLLGGGVAANRLLREKLQDAIQQDMSPVSCLMPHAILTGDNALMIACAAFFEKKRPLKNYANLSAEANLRLS